MNLVTTQAFHDELEKLSTAQLFPTELLWKVAYPGMPMQPAALKQLGQNMRRFMMQPAFTAAAKNPTQFGMNNVAQHLDHFKKNYPDILQGLRKSPLGAHMDDGALMQNFMMSHNPSGTFHDTARGLGVLPKAQLSSGVAGIARNAGTVAPSIRPPAAPVRSVVPRPVMPAARAPMQPVMQAGM
jgi:hypothetical protein